MGSYIFHNIHVYSIITRKGFSTILVHQWGEGTYGCLHIRIVINACFIYQWFDVFDEIRSNVDKEFVETIGIVLLIFMFYFHLQNGLEME